MSRLEPKQFFRCFYVSSFFDLLGSVNKHALFVSFEMNNIEVTCSSSHRDSPITGSGKLAPSSAVLVGGGWHLVRSPSQGYVKSRQDSLTMVSNLSTERKL
jgi:hypothetical protein